MGQTLRHLLNDYGAVHGENETKLLLIHSVLFILGTNK